MSDVMASVVQSKKLQDACSVMAKRSDQILKISCTVALEKRLANSSLLILNDQSKETSPLVTVVPKLAPNTMYLAMFLLKTPAPTKVVTSDVTVDELWKATVVASPTATAMAGSSANAKNSVKLLAPMAFAELPMTLRDTKNI